MPATASSNRQEDLVSRLCSIDGAQKLKALREVKNQIIGNRTKKISYVKLGVVPKVIEILASVDSSSSLLVQSAATVGSFACGIDAGVKAVIDGGAIPHLMRILSCDDEKVVDAAARSLRMVFQSKLTPKFDFLCEKNIKFLISLLNSANENITELAASIIMHSCETSIEQKALVDVDILQRMFILFDGSLNQRDASLDSLAVIIKNNPEVISKFVHLDNGKAFTALIELLDDRYPKSRLLACVCLIIIDRVSPCYLQDPGLKFKLISILVNLLEESGRAGDEAPFVLADLISNKEELQNIAFSLKAVEKLCYFLNKYPAQVKRLHGILLALSELCSTLEDCRSQFLSLKVLNCVTDALKHESEEVRITACICIRNVSRSIQNLSAGHLATEMVMTPLIQLLHDSSISVQVAALGAISNLVVDFATRKSIFIQLGGVKQLSQLSRSMDSTLRLNAVRALRNFTFLADRSCKEVLLKELTTSLLTSLISDPEALIQEQALAIVRNLIDGSVNSIDHIFTEDGMILNAVARQIRSDATLGVCIQAMYVLNNMSTGSEAHKEAVLNYLLMPKEFTPSIIIKFLQGCNIHLRTVTIWCIINLAYPESCGASSRIWRLREAGVVSQIKSMINDPCLDVKFRAKTALQYCSSISGGSSCL